MIARGIPSDKYPQWGCFEKDQAEALASIGHKVVVMCIDRRFLLEWRKIGLTHCNINDVEYYNYYLYPQKITDIISHKLSLRINDKLVQYVYNIIFKKHGRPDIIYGQMFGNTQMGICISRKYSIPIVGIEHLGRFNEKNLENWGYTQSDAEYTYHNIHTTIAVSNKLKESLYRHFSINADVVPNLVGKEFYYTNHTYKNQEFTIVSVGRLDYGKGFDLLIQALFAIKDKLPKNWQTIIIGDGEYNGELQQLLNNLNLQNNIHLIGKKNKKDIVVLLQQSDLFVLPSRSETFGVVYIEAMACGLPIIATDCGGPRDIVTESNGLLIPNENVDALSHAILHMVKNINKYDRKAIAEDCQARFSSEVIAKQLTQIFEDTIKKHKEKQ
jgi:glycosyltransferase involved in cell wall biosynthesis